MLSHDRATWIGGEGVGINVDFNNEPSAETLRTLCYDNYYKPISLCEILILTDDICRSNTVIFINFIQYGRLEYLDTYMCKCICIEVYDNKSSEGNCIVETFAAADKSVTKFIASAEQRTADVPRYTSTTDPYLTKLTEVKLLQHIV